MGFLKSTTIFSFIACLIGQAILFATGHIVEGFICLFGIVFNVAILCAFGDFEMLQEKTKKLEDELKKLKQSKEKEQ